MAALGLCFCRQLSSGCGEQGLRSRCGAGASLVPEHGLESARASFVVACGRAQAQRLRRAGLVPRPGIEPMSRALAGGGFSTGPPGKSWEALLRVNTGFHQASVSSRSPEAQDSLHVACWQGPYGACTTKDSTWTGNSTSLETCSRC